MRHNKKRNTALLYEFMIRHVSKCLIEKRNDEAVKAVNMIKRHFKSGPLQEELALFNAAFKSRVKTAEYGSKVIAEVLHHARKLDHAKLDEAKSALVKEINDTFNGQDFFSHKIPNYVMYASLQSLINDESGKRKLSVGRLQLEEKLVSFIVTERNTKHTLNEAMKHNPQYNSAVCKFVIKKFDKKYSGVLSESQKKLLNRYVISQVTGNTDLLFHQLRQEFQQIHNKLDFIYDEEVVKDKDLLHKISECKQKISVFPDKPQDNDIVTVLRLMALADEVAQ